MMPSHTQAGCFSGFNLPKLFSRKTRVEESVSADSDIIPHNRSNDVTGHAHDDGKHSHGIYFGDEWVVNETLPAYTDSIFHRGSDMKSADFINTIESKVDSLNAELRDLSLKIHGRPELAFEESFAHDILVDFMEKHGFQVTRSYAGMKTAWRAEYTVGSGGRVIGVNSEMDALPSIGHACGHNLIAICGVGIAVAVKSAMEDHCVPGKVIILGTPGEESDGGKIILLQKEAYKDMDVCLMAHPEPGVFNSSSSGTSTAIQGMTITYTGRTAHAAASPWEGKNALDAAVIAYSSISALRQQIKPDQRIHGIITGDNWTPNIIPDNATLTYSVRAPNYADLGEIVARVKACFEAAGIATGCTVKIEMTSSYFDLRQNTALASDFSDNVTSRYVMTTNATPTGASTDFGNVSYEVPALHPIYAIPTEVDGGNHTAAFAKSSKSQEAHDATIKVLKGLAITGFRVLHDAAFFQEVKSAFEVDKKSRGAA